MTNPVLSREVTTPSEVAAERKRARLNAFGAWWKRWWYLAINVAAMSLLVAHSVMRDHEYMAPRAPGQILDAQGVIVDLQGCVTIDGLKPHGDHQIVILRVRGDAACSSRITASSASVPPDERIMTPGDKPIVLPIGSAVTLRSDYGWRMVATASSTIPLLTPTPLTDDCHAMQARGLTVACGNINRIPWTGSSSVSSNTNITGATP